MKKYPVCAIVLNWNGWRDTLECLESLTVSEVVPDTIIVVDNGSADDSILQIQKWGKSHYDKIVLPEKEPGDHPRNKRREPPFLIIPNGTNRGFAGGINSGLNWVLSKKAYEFIWVLNNDIIVKDDCLAKLLECSRYHSAGILGSTVVYADRKQVVQCAGGYSYQPLTTICKPFLGGKSLARVTRFSERVKIDYIYGASLFAGSEVFEQCGIFNEDYFLFYEEIDLCHRARKVGYGIHWCRESIVYHKVSKSVGVPGTAASTNISFANYHENLSTLLYTKRFHAILLPLVMFFRLFGKLVMISKKRQWYLLKPLFDAYHDFIRGRNKKNMYISHEKIELNVSNNQRKK